MTWLRDAKRIQLPSLYESQAAEKKLAVHEGNLAYNGKPDFEPAGDHGQFAFSIPELARAADHLSLRDPAERTNARARSVSSFSRLPDSLRPFNPPPETARPSFRSKIE